MNGKKRKYYAVQYTDRNPYNLSAEYICAWGGAAILMFGSKKARDEWVNAPIPYRDSCSYEFARVATHGFDPDYLVDTSTAKLDLEMAWKFQLNNN